MLCAGNLTLTCVNHPPPNILHILNLYSQHKIQEIKKFYFVLITFLQNTIRQGQFIFNSGTDRHKKNPPALVLPPILRFFCGEYRRLATAIKGNPAIYSCYCRHLLNTTVPSLGPEPVFKPDGTQRRTTLKIVNLRPTTDHIIQWEEVIIKALNCSPQTLEIVTFYSKIMILISCLRSWEEENPFLNCPKHKILVLKSTFFFFLI